MVANIYTGQTPVQELQGKFTDELRGKMKEAALIFKCNVEELKYRVGNDGVVEISRMTPDEMIEMSAQDDENKRKRSIKIARGLI